jgi:hypothetical protein
MSAKPPDQIWGVRKQHVQDTWLFPKIGRLFPPGKRVKLQYQTPLKLKPILCGAIGAVMSISDRYSGFAQGWKWTSHKSRKAIHKYESIGITAVFTECVLCDPAYIVGRRYCQVFTAIDLQFVVFWAVKMEAISSSETWAGLTTYITIR